MLAGLFFIVLGFYTFSKPLESYLALTIVFSWSFLITGILEIVFSLVNRKNIDNWGWMLVSGILNVALGFLLLAQPVISITVLPLFVGFFVLFSSVSAIGYSLDLKRFGTKGWGWLTFIGVLGLLFAFGLIINPVLSGMTIVIWTGLAFISTGVYHIYFSIRLKKLKTITGS